MSRSIPFMLLMFFVSVSLTAQTVYITKTGSKYHEQSCSSLRYSSEPINLSDAVNGGYTPCSKCNPPTFNMPKSDLQTTPDSKSTTSKTPTTKKQCIAITEKGTQCGRNAEVGSDYCWQHKNTINKSTSNNKSPDKTILTGPRGGKYYINSKGKKVYIKKK